jgi:hypothetical protein
MSEEVFSSLKYAIGGDSSNLATQILVLKFILLNCKYVTLNLF